MIKSKIFRKIIKVITNINNLIKDNNIIENKNTKMEEEFF